MTETPRGGQSADRIDLPPMPLPPELPADDFSCCSQPDPTCSKSGSSEEPKYTESDMRVLTEAALRLGRKEALDEAADFLDGSAEMWATPDDYPEEWDATHLIVRNASQIALQNAAGAVRDMATSGRTDPGDLNG